MRFNTSSVATLVLTAFAAASLFLLLAEHRAHSLGLWLLMLVPLCLVLLYLASTHARSDLDAPGSVDPATPSDKKKGHP
ncbi:hypothetical protein BURC_02216 [Burkholderiaceae bacterium]|nr:hypothetical protein BURC_02216 [Burkholderiaceae bacterium]